MVSEVELSFLKKNSLPRNYAAFLPRHQTPIQELGLWSSGRTVHSHCTDGGSIPPRSTRCVWSSGRIAELGISAQGACSPLEKISLGLTISPRSTKTRSIATMFL